MKKCISLLLCIGILIPCFCLSSYASSATNYPFIFVHGLMGWGEYQGIDKVMPYWGTTSGNIPKYLERKGYDIYTACVGGNSSAWDRACELYAQLTGSRVDYGEAHSEEHGHSRFGRTYNEPLCPTFGQKDKNGNIIKVNLVGHSMGGVTIRLFSSILEYGAKEEVRKSGNNVSPFFKGGKGSFIHSITTLSAPHNGALTADKDNDALINLMVNSFYYIWGILDNTPLRPIWDIQLEHVGLTDYPDDGFDGKFDPELIKELLNSKDNAYYDLTVKGAKEANEKIKMLDNVYYFSYSTECVFEGPVTGRYYPEPSMNPLFFFTSPKVCNYDKDELMGIPIDESWRRNDGIVSTVSSAYPFDEPHTDFDKNNIKKGIWNVMPLLESTDHTDFMGTFTNPVEIRKFYLDVCAMPCELK